MEKRLSTVVSSEPHLVLPMAPGPMAVGDLAWADPESPRGAGGGRATTTAMQLLRELLLSGIGGPLRFVKSKSFVSVISPTQYVQMLYLYIFDL